MKKRVAIKAEEGGAKQRLSVLELAETLDNVSEACRQRGMTRTQFYEYKRRFQAHGLDGLKDLPPIHRSHPFTTQPEVAERILAKSLEKPDWGCVRLSNQLKVEGISVSSPTIQNILIKNGMGSKHERLLKLEEKALQHGIELTPGQVSLIGTINPCFWECHTESSRPGELLSQGTFYVGGLKRIGRVYLHTLVDTYGSYAFGFLFTTKELDAAVVLLHSDVLPFYKNLGLTVLAVLTDNGFEFWGKGGDQYELYLAFNGIKHRHTQVHRQYANGFLERFKRTVLDEFFRPAFRTKFNESIVALQKDFDFWLIHYNTERSHEDYPNKGKCPFDMINDYLSTAKKET